MSIATWEAKCCFSRGSEPQLMDRVEEMCHTGRRHATSKPSPGNTESRSTDYRALPEKERHQQGGGVRKRSSLRHWFF